MDNTQPITENDIADFLLNTPDFFSRHAQVLASVQLSSPHGSRAVSLQERQAELLREKIKSLEHRVVDMMRHGSDNMLIADKLQRWTLTLLQQTDPEKLPETVASELQAQFSIPQVALRLWGLGPSHEQRPYCADVSEDVRAFVATLTVPFVGVNPGFEAVRWLAHPQQAASLALLPVRRPGHGSPVFGLVVLASPDSYRFHAGMGTDFLERIGEAAGAALARLQGS
jgi:uncharacterized protein YigA (DUF484 family)